MADPATSSQQSRGRPPSNLPPPPLGRLVIPTCACTLNPHLRLRLSPTQAAPPPTLRLDVAFHRHSLTMEAGGCFVTLGRGAYDKLCVLHRIHGPEEERVPVLDDGQEEAEAAEEEVGADPTTHLHARGALVRSR
jgi:hypothetical protein